MVKQNLKMVVGLGLELGSDLVSGWLVVIHTYLYYFLLSSSRLRRNWNIQFATAGQTEMFAAENFGDWHAAVGGGPL